MKFLHPSLPHRGNALILVVGILVLLVLVATAFITRTQSGRVTAIAQRDTARIDDRARTIGRMAAEEVAIALFPRIVSPSNIAANISANAQKAAPTSDALRYGHDPDFPFNFAAYEVVPWTNPPDDLINGIPLTGPENPIGGPSFGDTRWLRDTEPRRADLYDMMGQAIPQWQNFEADGTPETFTYWRHLTNLTRSGNALRIVRDISDVFGGGLETDLDVPVEQWPTFAPRTINGNALVVGLDYNNDGNVDQSEGLEHLARWNRWFSLLGWANAQLDASLLPQNFVNLSDLDGDGIQNEMGERPTDAFVQGSNRYYAELMMTDADGDGFTDSLWHLFPQSIGPDTRQIVAFSITDNSARGNMNVATAFHRKNYYGSDTFLDRRGEATRGHTPADLAIVGQTQYWDANLNVSNWRVGFLDNLANLPGNAQYNLPFDPQFPEFGEQWIVYDQTSNGSLIHVDWDINQWDHKDNASILDELGIQVNGSTANGIFNGSLNPTNDITSMYGRLWYWQLAGRKPFEATWGLRPYTIPDELELRITEGNNYQFAGSRYERSLNRVDGSADNQVIRSDMNRHEASELRDQLDNSQLVFDNRRKLTLFSGVRNDLLPPWLRWQDRFWKRHDPDALDLPVGYGAFDILNYTGYANPIGLYGSAFPAKVAIEATNAYINNGLDTDALENAITNWLEQSNTKVDLRAYYGDSSFGAPWWESNEDGRLTLAERAPLQILLALTDTQESGLSSLDATPADAHSPLGTYGSPDPTAAWSTIDTNYYQQARVMAAGLASNVLSYRDEDDEWRMHSPLSFMPTGTSRNALPLSAAVTPPIVGRQGNTVVGPTGYEAFADTPVASPNGLSIQMLGMEAQPMIVEAFVAHAHQAKVPETSGACCLETGGCQEVSQETCEGLLGGTFEGGSCDGPDGIPDTGDEPCSIQGACCLDAGGCITTTEAGCLSLLGTYRGDGADCLDQTCTGACCFNNGACEDMSAFSCAQVEGAYQGNDSDCGSNPCVILGACCLPSGSCMDVISPNACTTLGGSYIGGQTCATFPCDGACCVDFAECLIISEAGCSELAGSFLGLGQPCSSFVCITAGACCVGSSSCTEVISVDECIALNGTFLSGESCTDSPCFGSCCLSSGVCEELSIISCASLAGEFIQGASCSSAPCRSACCFSTGGCENLLQSQCAVFNGVYIGGGATCSSNPCTPAGACCLPDSPSDPNDGGCIEVLPAGCAILGGTYLGDGVSCGSVPCGTNSVRGGCCLTTGFCQNVVSLEACVNLGGIYQGDLISCNETPCNPESACCIGDTSCIDLLEANCLDIGGIFNAGLVCADGACEGACCLPDGSCTDMLLSDCAIAGGLFNDSLTCAASPCDAAGACCVGNATCDVTSAIACVATLGGTYQGDGTTCVTDPCGIGVEGACCMEPVGCVLVLQSSCIDAGGTWDGSPICNATICSAGACCIDGDCVMVINGTACTALGGVYSGDGSDCFLDAPCVGACCLWGGGCETLSQSSCDDLGSINGPPGFFNGVGTVCGAVPCPPSGTCCLPSGTCVDIMSNHAFAIYCQTDLGGVYTAGSSCATIECGGGCCLSTGGCEDLSEAACLEVSGIFQGTGVFCASNPCGVEGQCCFESGSCLLITNDSCDFLGGTFSASPDCTTTPCISYFLVTNDTTDCPQESIAVVQLANPFDRVIDLEDYAVELFGQDYKLSGLGLKLEPSTPQNPVTLILYALPEASTIIDPAGTHDFNAEWLDFLDIEVKDHPEDDLGTPSFTEGTVLVQVPNADWSTDRTYYDDLDPGTQNSVALYKFDDTTRVLIDRLDAPNSTIRFDDRIVEDIANEWAKVGDTGYIALTDSEGDLIEADANKSALFIQWDHATRAWGVDIPDFGGWHNDTLDAWEINPRYIFAAHDMNRSQEIRDVTNAQASPTVQDILYSAGFYWTEFSTPDDFDGDGNPDTASDPDLLADDPDPWFSVEVWSPRAGIIRPVGPAGIEVPGEVQGGLRFRKPTYFDMNHSEDPLFVAGLGDPNQQPWSYPDKGWYGQREDTNGDDSSADTPAFEDTNLDDSIGKNESDIAMAFPLQMLQKDEDFEQVGELLYCWLFGHMLEGTYDTVDIDPLAHLVLPISPLDGGTGAIDAGTVTTFSEFMYPDVGDWWASWVGTIEGGEIQLDARVNRLRFIPDGDDDLPLMMAGRSEIDGFTLDPIPVNHPWPRLSIAARVLDSFVCDGPGRPDLDGDGIGDDLLPNGAAIASPTIHSYFNANGFTGKATPGMININTAPVEVLRMLPHSYKVVHATQSVDSSVLDAVDRNPRSLFPESIVQYREGSSGDPNPLFNSDFTGGPNFRERSLALGLAIGAGPKNTRGFSSPAEVGMLRVNGGIDDVWEPWNIQDKHQAIRDRAAWRIDFAGAEPFGDHDSTGASNWIDTGIGAPISTDVNFRDYYGEDTIAGDGVSGDAEELNLLQAGISNLITTTSDMFTIHMRIRTFKRNPITGVWNATDLDYIVDDSRYVMLVDRSNVNSPDDKPRILYFEKLPN